MRYKRQAQKGLLFCAIENKDGVTKESKVYERKTSKAETKRMLYFLLKRVWYVILISIMIQSMAACASHEVPAYEAGRTFDTRFYRRQNMTKDTEKRTPFTADDSVRNAEGKEHPGKTDTSEQTAGQGEYRVPVSFKPDVHVDLAADILEAFQINLPGKGEKIEILDRPQAKNEDYHIRVRRYRSSLITSGLAVLAFALWTLFKSILEITSQFKLAVSDMHFSNPGTEIMRDLINDNQFIQLSIISFLIFLGAELALRVYVGISAHSIGRGKKKKRNVWLLGACFLLGYEIATLVIFITAFRQTLQTEGILGFAIILLVQATSVYIDLELVLSGFRYTRLLKRLKVVKEQKLREQSPV